MIAKNLNIKMKNIENIIEEQEIVEAEKNMPSTKSILNIISEDARASAVIHRKENYEANKTKSARDIKFLLKHKQDKTIGWVNYNLVNEEEANEILGVFVDGMYYPIGNNMVVKKLVNRLTK
jgi:hypothetical protein